MGFMSHIYKAAALSFAITILDLSGKAYIFLLYSFSTGKRHHGLKKASLQ
jgi:hypothetical protein